MWALCDLPISDIALTASCRLALMTLFFYSKALYVLDDNMINDTKVSEIEIIIINGNLKNELTRAGSLSVGPLPVSWKTRKESAII